MRLFNTIAVEITARCNRKCSFCPVSWGSDRPDERMDFRLVRKIRRELDGYQGRVELYIYNEPTRDWDYLIRCLREFRQFSTMIATNGDYLSPQRVEELRAAGLNSLLINLYTETAVKRNQIDSSMERGKNLKIYTAHKGWAVWVQDKTKWDESGPFALQNRSRGPVIELPRMCVKPFRVLNINWRGDALLCCNDYEGEVPIANVRDMSLIDIWHHKVFMKYRACLRNKKRILPLCNRCDAPAGAYSWRVDFSDL